MESAAEPAIRSSEAYRQKVRTGYLPLTVQAERVTLARGTDGACLFLDSDAACELHRELGGEAKPLVCQTYPYLFTETPDGVFTSLSYACPAALEGVGPLLEETRTELEALIEARWRELPQAASVGERVYVSPQHWLSWGDYLALEHDLLLAFSPERPVESLLATAVNLILAEPNEPGQLAPPPGGWSLAAAYNLGGFDRELTSMVSCNLLAITEDVTDPEERARLGSFLWNGGQHYSAKFSRQLPPFSLRQPSTPQAVELIDRYVRNAILGKRLLSGTVPSRLLALACGIAILLFYIEALTEPEEDGRTAPFSFEASDRAFTLVESELLSHTRSFDGFFVEFEAALRNVRDGLRGDAG